MKATNDHRSSLTAASHIAVISASSSAHTAALGSPEADKDDAGAAHVEGAAWKLGGIVLQRTGLSLLHPRLPV